ncbi:hypothetical protein [Microbacterium sp. MM2322]|uniref:hypothetical protein n=1 Tax=Microbacterium sp. MM2322 TaxID=3157631 RepID=UPI0032D58E76
MITRIQARLIGFGVAGIIVLTVAGLLAESFPWLLTSALTVVVVAVIALVVLTVVAAVAVATALPPLTPISETSILGKHTASLGKLLVRLLAFFGNTALAWFVALNVAFQSREKVDLSIPHHLWAIFLILAALIAYTYWLWIAGDLLRSRKTGRQRGLVRISKHWLRRLRNPPLERFLLRLAAWLMDDPWLLIFVLTISPLVLTAVVSGLYNAITHA